jgi:two-component system, OmpR family, phosphate regulon response regulator PhoB
MASRRTILLVEDDPVILEVIEFTLQRRGYCVQSARDGNAAMALIAQGLPDIAVLDMMLPGKSGFQITQRLKEESKERVFVVMMSGNTSIAHRDYALSTGVDRFLAKPFALAKLLEAVEGLCPPAPTARINGSGVTPQPAAMAVRSSFP